MPKRKGHDLPWAGWVDGVSHVRCAACGIGYVRDNRTLGYRLAHERSHPSASTGVMPIDPMIEVLLTTWALSQMKGKRPPLNQAFPPYLSGALRKARKLGFVEVGADDCYLDDLGCAYLDEHGYSDAI